MSVESAKSFVARMREDKDFRGAVSNCADTVSLWETVTVGGFDFDENELVQAIAACMTEMGG